ncbi:TIGR03016 family PEP-CTERM system-associated outer membrane protein [Paraglaciecola hydrolytica]|uniref:TIGR03016 family PEP-CTERM system-associated outer membrane protein n=1 Tax=Paraglaciecola hydrolytica TaxID=1799789 RepID=A0A135ZZU3_9ALTE|nr:TIGR03016 family PEP-CTERM system-associated outer membrane protein [Paraglaciecola hydrolytica]KXI28484.1 hypothetical protein AX660_15440 [Paraglaciecola hydrolytica]
MWCKDAVSNRKSKFFYFVGLGFTTFFSSAGDLNLKSGVKSTAYFYQTQRDELPKEQTEALVLEPNLTGIYDSKKIDFAVNIAHTIVEQSYDEEGADKNYTDVKLNSSINLIENALRLSIFGAQNYRASSQSQNDFSDKILSAGDLSQVQQYGASLDYFTPNASYIGLDMSSTYSNLSTDKSIDENFNGLDSENVSFFSRLRSGKELRLVTFDFSGQYTDTTRTGYSNFKSDSLNGNIHFNLFKQFNLVVLGNQTNYDLDRVDGLGRSDIDTQSYGAGIELSNSDNRRVQITYNRLKEENNTTNYVGVDLNWAFSQRTSISLNYGKRFYGDAYSLNAKHNLKNFKSSLSYSEDVTTFSRLNFETESLGIFVCIIGSTDLIDCFQPEGLDYVLQPGEEFRSYNDISVDITNEVILSKSARYALGYSKRKLKISLGLSYRETDYLETDRSQIAKSASLSSNYQLSKRTNLGIGFNFLRKEANESIDYIDTISANFSANRALSENAKLDLAFRYLDRQSEVGDITDKRITLGFNYQF